MSNNIVEGNLQGRILIEAQLENKTPLLVGSGEDKTSDSELMRCDVHNVFSSPGEERPAVLKKNVTRSGQPFIPGTSMMGALKHHLKRNDWLKFINDKEKEKELHHLLFGDLERKSKKDEEELFQSHFIIDDLYLSRCEEIRTTIRDGVRIEHASNTAKPTGKYDYEILEPGHTFDFKAEIVVRKSDVEDAFYNSFVDLIKKVLDHPEVPFQVGALTSHGFGQLQLVEEENSWRVYDFREDPGGYFDFLLNPEDVKTSSLETDSSNHYFKFEPQPAFAIDMTLEPTTPFMIGGGTPEKDADDGSLKSNGNYIVSAKSMKGAVRHHAYRIANTVHDNRIAEGITSGLFGSPADEKGDKKRKKSRFWTSDAFIRDPVDPSDAKVQTQVAIDRFTGGAMDSALFQTEPVWPKEGKTEVEVTWRIMNGESDNIQAEIGLLLLVARDLMTEFLAIGGQKAIGRGRFIGKKACIKHNLDENENTWLLDREGKNLRLKEGEQEALNDFVQHFLSYKNTESERG